MMGPVTVPTGCSVFPREIRRPSRRQAEQRFHNIHYWSEPEKGGHFAAFEQPAIFVDEVRSSIPVRCDEPGGRHIGTLAGCACSRSPRAWRHRSAPRS